MTYQKLILALLMITCLDIVYANDWKHIFGHGHSFNKIIINKNNPSILYTNNDKSLYRSDDKGINWKIIGEITEGSISDIVLNPHQTNIIYAIVNVNHSGNIYKSIDNGETWTKDSVYAGNSITSFKINPFNTNITYLLTGKTSTTNIFYISNDSGINWDSLGNVNTFSSSQGNSMAVDPHNPNIIYVSVFETIFDPTTSGIFKSINQGLTWNNVKSNLLNSPPFNDEAIPIAINNHEPGIIYIGNPGNNSIEKSEDGGITWKRVTPDSLNISVESIAIDHHNPDIIYAGTTTGLYRTTNAGNDWQLISMISDGNELNIKSIAIDPHNPENIYIATRDNGIYYLESDSNCFANYDSTTKKLFVPCLKANNELPLYEVEMTGNNNSQFEVSNIGTR